jgi:hypothetical protein
VSGVTSLLLPSSREPLYGPPSGGFANAYFLSADSCLWLWGQGPSTVSHQILLNFAQDEEQSALVIDISSPTSHSAQVSLDFRLVQLG